MEQDQDQQLAFRDAVRKSLSDSPEGMGILAYPQRFHSLVADNCDPDSLELDIFDANHDEPFVRIFREAALEGYPAGIPSVVETGTTYLHEERHLDKGQARLLCHALAAGIADFLNIPSDAPGMNRYDQPTSPYVPSNATDASFSAASPMSMTPPVMPIAPSVAQQRPAVSPMPQQPTDNGTMGWSSSSAPAPVAPAARKKGTVKMALIGALSGMVLMVAVLFATHVLPLPGGTGSPNSGDSSLSPFDSPVPDKNVTYEVSFETGGGTRIESEQVKEGDNVYSPEDPTKDGYDFVGWYEDDAFANPVSFPFVPEGDMVLYAKWEKTTVLDGAVATLYANGHTYALYDANASWQEAESLCENLGGHLATVTSRLEQGTIEELLASGSRNCYWIGGFLAAPQVWQWVTGETFSYSNWCEGVPDNWIIEGPNKDATAEQRSNIAASENAISVYRVANPNAPHYANEWNDLASNGDCNGEAFFGLDNIGYLCEWDSIVE